MSETVLRTSLFLSILNHRHIFFDLFFHFNNKYCLYDAELKTVYFMNSN
jgi:hypothetical protein